jgi:hypothetical protein
MNVAVEGTGWCSSLSLTPGFSWVMGAMQQLKTVLTVSSAREKPLKRLNPHGAGASTQLKQGVNEKRRASHSPRDTPTHWR